MFLGLILHRFDFIWGFIRSACKRNKWNLWKGHPLSYISHLSREHISHQLWTVYLQNTVTHANYSWIFMCFKLPGCGSFIAGLFYIICSIECHVHVLTHEYTSLFFCTVRCALLTLITHSPHAWVFCEACILHVHLKTTADLFCICSFVPATSCPSRSCHWSPEGDGAGPAYLMKGCVLSLSSSRLEWVCLSGCLSVCGCYSSLIVLLDVAVSVHRNQYTC